MKLAEDLKKAVLQAAMQGKLTKQLETDSSVDELLKKIAEEKAKLIAEGKIKKDKTKAGASGRALAEITEEEIPFDIPENWRWERIGNCFEVTMGSSPDSFSINEKSCGIEFHQGKIFFGKQLLQSSNIYTSKPTKMVNKDNILLCVRAPVGKINLLDREICIGRGLAGLRGLGLLNKEYLYRLLQTYESYFNKKATGSTFKAIGKDTILETLFPLPPIEEQHRIVEKLNAILPIIDSMAVYGTKKKAGRPKQEEALAFISSLLGTKKRAEPKPVSPEITELKAKAKEEFPAIVKKYAELMDVTYNRITIRHQKTRWGSCTKTGNLNFNCLIMKMPENVRDYVIIHELAHRKELNHSSKFWTIVAEYCPWYKEAKLWLKENGQKLMEQ